MNEDLLWEKVLKRVKEEVSSLVYITWFEPTKLKILDDGKAVIIVPLEIQKKHLSERYYEMIIDYLTMETDKINEVSFLVEDELTDEEDIGYVARHANTF